MGIPFNIRRRGFAWSLFKFIELAALAALTLAGCTFPAPRRTPDGVRLTPLKTYSRFADWVRLRLAGLSGIGTGYDVDCYRMLYRTHDGAGSPIEVSGLLALPRGAQARRLVSFQHGTTTTRGAVPSRLDSTGEAAAVVIAGNGYALIAPDYIGLGSSPGQHPYLIAQDEARAVTDMIAAARGIEGVPDGPVFLSGFSQGGQASLAAMRTLERDGEQVLGAAPVAGPYDIRNAFGTALFGHAPADSLYLAYMSWAYAGHYGHPLESVLTSDYARRARDLFENPHSPQQIMAALPANPRTMFNAVLLQAFDSGESYWFLDALRENDVSDWSPRAPVRLYYGSADIDVLPEQALEAQRVMRARGSDVTAVDVGPVDHDASIVVAGPLILAWLESLDADGRVVQKSGTIAAAALPQPASDNTFDAANEMAAFNGTAVSYDANGDLNQRRDEYLRMGRAQTSGCNQRREQRGFRLRSVRAAREQND